MLMEDGFERQGQNTSAAPSNAHALWDSATAPEAVSIQRVLARYVEVNNIQFTIGGGTRLRAEQVFQPECLMPIVALEANRIWQMLAKHPNSSMGVEGRLGAVYARDQNENSYFPYIAHPPVIGDDITSTMRLLVFLLSARRVLGLKENQTIDLYPHIRQWDSIDWEGAQESGEVPEIPLPEGFDLDFQRKEFISDLQRKIIPAALDATSEMDPRPQN